MEHECWVGNRYREEGLAGQKIAVVGYSHWFEDGMVDHPGATLDAISNVIAARAGYDRIAFFRKIASYFGFADQADFWPCVLFFNVIPNAIGSFEQKFRNGTKEQVEQGKARARRIMAEHRPDKVLVFSAKGWSSMPLTVEEERGEPLERLGKALSRFTYGTYAVGGKTILAYGLRHPQGARSDVMRSAVSQIMAVPTAG